MSAKPIHISVIYGSIREGRLCDAVVDWVVGEIRRIGEFSIDVIDPKTLDLTQRQDKGAGAPVSALKQRIRAADAAVVVTPEYNHGYPACLKSLIDSMSDEWHAKPVAFVSYGGISGGLRAVEQLRLVFAELHAVTIRDAVSFADAPSQFGGHGRLQNPERARGSLYAMLASLRWWASVLRHGRRIAPYAERAARASPV